MRKLIIIAFLALAVGFIMALVALILPGAGDAMGGFFGGILGSTAGIITGTVVGLMEWGSASFINAAVVLVGTTLLSAITWIILTRALWPRIQTMRGPPTTTPAIQYQTQPTVAIPTMQSQPATYTAPKEEVKES